MIIRIIIMIQALININISIFKADNVYSINISLPYGPPMNTEITRRVVSLSKIHLPPKCTGNTQEAVAPSRHN